MINLKRRGFLQDLEIEKDTPCWLQGVVSEAKGYGVFLLWKRLKKSLLYLIPEEKQSESIYQDLKTFAPEKVLHLPLQNKTSLADIYRILNCIEKTENFILVCSLKAALQKVPSLDSAKSDTFIIRRGSEIDRDKLVKWLVEKGYKNVPLVEERGDYSVRGSIIDFYSPFYSNPLRVEFFADKVESIRKFDPYSQRSVARLEKVILSARDELCFSSKTCKKLSPFIKIIPPSCLLILDEPLTIEDRIKKMLPEEQEYGKQLWHHLLSSAKFYISTFYQEREGIKFKRKISLNSSSLPFWAGDLDTLAKDIRSWQEKDWQINIITPTSGQGRRIQELLQEKNLDFKLKERFDLYESHSLLITLGDLEKGFIFQETKDIIITDRDIFKRYTERGKRWKILPEERKIKSWSELKEGDYVVHIDYGIGKFKGLVTLKVMGKWADYFQIDYKGSDRLYVPLSQMDRLHKYIGDSDNPPPIYNLEGGQWEFTKRRVQKATRELASSLLQLYSLRKVKAGHSFSPDTDWQLEFEASFPYEETVDQLKATQQVKQDMESPIPMDRLICGDSGYGKTEIAIRASFKAVMDNKQVAVLVPTTILAEQHYRNFSERMADYPINVQMLSRFQPEKEQTKIIENLKRGRIDIIIGTHRLLQKDICFNDLGLVIIDEEQRFGVVQKKKLRDLCKTVDVLTLSATPIPRSLYMALTGIFQLSTVFSPPRERQNVEIEVASYQEAIIKDAIIREISQGGQVFYLYNRVQDIHLVAEKLKTLLPQVRFAVAHGQMRATQLEKTVRDFLHQKYDVLVCTSIIESGIDMPNVNTLIVENAEQFGLADLYQLRGRVGRGIRKGYAYFLFNPVKPLTEQAKRRLQIIHQFKGPGAGFKIAMEDLHIRGAGNLLGKEQHGHILAVGFTLYSQLLSEEIKKLKGEKVKPSFPVHIELGTEARIPPFYVPYISQRMQFYQKIGKIEKEEEILELKEELKDRFGNLPLQVRNLIHLLHIKLLAKDVGICSMREENDHHIKVTFSPLYPLSKQKKEKLQKSLSGKIKTFPLDERNLLILKKDGEKDERFLIWVRGVLQKMKDVLI